MKPKILTRYIIFEFIPPLLLGVSIFTFVLLLDKIFDLMDLFLSKGVGFITVLKLLIFIFPSILTLTIPMGFLLGSLLAFGRLSEDGEITAFRASGQHLRHLLWPPLLTAFLMCFVLIAFNSEIAPYSQNAFRNLYREVIKQNPLFQLEEKTFLEILNIRLYVHSIDEDSGLLKGVHIYRIEDNAPPTRIRAQEGTAQSSGSHITFNLKDGTIQQMDPAEPARTT
ncbi:MAG: LptF/LptG family permease, partial [bacterium]